MIQIVFKKIFKETLAKKIYTDDVAAVIEGSSLKHSHFSAHRSHLLWETTVPFCAFAVERLCNYIRITESHVVQMPLANLNSKKDNASCVMTCFSVS